MSGHNRWAKVKHVKAKQDKIKGKLFTKAIKELTISAKNGGGDPALNASLRVAIQKAKDVNMPHYGRYFHTAAEIKNEHRYYENYENFIEQT